ncbi:GNAT family N-acetyltransferase [Flagellimonas myxillae]|uniref:GNAT family N-acetyltransferase n=1 Tax=Flagellimonas myxillae TaxID=2942214 RepID=UPI00201EAEF0|nr:GNAT family N-acetyltransferase [Muricauda myxillae]MCL6265338.1 GNAT family N-acetyltransferase [Muricauda myxillae]
MVSITAAHSTEDFKTISELARNIWTQHYTPIIGEQQVTYMLDKFQSSAAIEGQVKNGYSYFLLQYEQVPVGYFAFRVDEDFLFLSKIYVQSSHRGKGVGRRAIEFMKTRVKELNLKKIRLTVNKYNSNSIKAYEKIGFINVDSVVQDIGNGFVMDDYVLEKKID